LNVSEDCILEQDNSRFIKKKKKGSVIHFSCSTKKN